MRTWVIPCRYDPIVFDCVGAIKLHHPEDRVVVVDSCSDDTAYLADLGCDTIKGNDGYHPGAYRLALEQFESDSWAFIHDSLIVQRNLDDRVTDLTAVRWFDPYVPPDQLDHVLDHLNHMEWQPAKNWRGVFGTMLFCSDWYARWLQRLGFFDFPCTSKVEASATERTLGMCLPPDFDTLQGHQTTLHASYDETFVRKVMKDRQ